MNDYHDAEILREARRLLADEPEGDWLARAQHDVGECDVCDAIRVATATALADDKAELTREVFHIVMASRATTVGNEAFREPPRDEELAPWAEHAHWLLDVYQKRGAETP